MRWALGLVSAGTIGRVAKNPGELVKQGSKLLGASPEVKALTEDVRGRLVEAGKAAAVEAASSQINSLTGRLQERASLQQQFRPSGGDSGDGEEERRPSERRGREQGSRHDDEGERSPRRVADEDDLADEEEDEEQEERQPAMRGERSQRLRRDEEGEAEEARPPARSARRITDEDEIDDDTSGRSRRSPVRRVRR
jgi:hypothetical protein